MRYLMHGFAALLLSLIAPPASAQSFSLAPLPYSHDALAPVIDEQTMRIHHGRHHQAYVDNLNKAVAASPALAGLSLEALLAEVSKAGDAVRNNGGGHWNHTFFWQSMTRPGQGGSPSPDLLAAINRDFGSLDQFKTAFRAAGLTRFGSGWAWLIVTPDGRLKVSSTPNQDNPLMDIVADRGQPILGNDVWEHAYYLQYQNRRGDYLDAWWQLVDWTVISRRYADSRK
jgi:Fe-Mn family superoxide dismutase